MTRGPFSHKPIGEANVLVAGLIRDGAASLTREVERLLAATADFRRVQVLLIESDSSDDTLATLAGMASRSEHIHFISLGQLAPSWPQRAARLAHCRNAYVEAIRSDPRYRDVDYVLISDLDGMNGLLDRAALQSCFQVQEAWDVLTANQDGPYYDIWALRHPDWSPDDCLRLLSRLEPLFGHEAARDIAVYSRQVRIPRSSPPIAVQSAFGGLALYTREALLCGGYEGLDAEGFEVCEHVPHHARIRAAGHRIFINPQLINTAWTIHTRNKQMRRVIKQAIRTGIRQWRQNRA